MLDTLFADPKAVDRLRRTPLGCHLDSFATAMLSLGYERSTVRHQLYLLRDLGHWLKRRGVSVSELEESALERFLVRCRKRGRATQGDATTVRRFLAHLRERDIVPRVDAPLDDSAIAQLLRRYQSYLRQERGLAPATVANYLPFVREFLKERFGDGPLDLGALSSSYSEGFVVRHAPATCAKRAQLMVSALRSFLRFLLQEGEIATDLASGVPTVANRSQNTVPKYLSSEEVERLLESCDRSTAAGRRDYAILLLFARLGLRAGEVRELALDDIHWRAGEIVVRGKGKTRDRLPLLPDVGEALAAYLRQDRAPSPDRQVFLRVRAPHRAMGNVSSISVIVSRALRRAGLQPPLKGAHLLRHSLATGLLRSGATMTEIAQVLRHRRPQTTEIYAKVDLVGLRALAPPWPGNGGGQ